MQMTAAPSSVSPACHYHPAPTARLFFNPSFAHAVLSLWSKYFFFKATDSSSLPPFPSFFYSSFFSSTFLESVSLCNPGWPKNHYDVWRALNSHPTCFYFLSPGLTGSLHFSDAHLLVSKPSMWARCPFKCTHRTGYHPFQSLISSCNCSCCMCDYLNNKKESPIREKKNLIRRDITPFIPNPPIQKCLLSLLWCEHTSTLWYLPSCHSPHLWQCQSLFSELNLQPSLMTMAFNWPSLLTSLENHVCLL